MTVYLSPPEDVDNKYIFHQIII